jgi:hypothetical protein
VVDFPFRTVSLPICFYSLAQVPEIRKIKNKNVLRSGLPVTALKARIVWHGGGDRVKKPVTRSFNISIFTTS